MKKINKKVIILSLIGLGFIVLTFLFNWLFIIPTAIILFLNQKELIKKNNHQTKISEQKKEF